MGLTRHCCAVLIALAISAGITAAAPYALAQTVTCDETGLSVNATSIKAEDLIKAIGNECGIKMVLRGELFTEDVFSVRFENMPIRSGLERILRVVNIPNHMMHFAETDNQNHVIKIDLIGKKGAERELTSGEQTTASEQTDTPSRQAPPRRKKSPPSTKKPERAQRQETAIEPPDEILNESREEEEPVEEKLKEPDPALPEEMPDGLEQQTEE